MSVKTIPIDADLLLLLSSRVVQAGNQYLMGGKVGINADSKVVKASRLDCSGYVRWLIKRSAGIKIPDGSVVQHDWVKAQGFREVEPLELGELSGEVYISFLPPIDPHAGHVALVYNGETLESCGGQGPTRRKFTSTGWWEKTTCYRLT